MGLLPTDAQHPAYVNCQYVPQLALAVQPHLQLSTQVPLASHTPDVLLMVQEVPSRAGTVAQAPLIAEQFRLIIHGSSAGGHMQALHALVLLPVL
jgi:hypothetical protein